MRRQLAGNVSLELTMQMDYWLANRCKLGTSTDCEHWWLLVGSPITILARIQVHSRRVGRL